MGRIGRCRSAWGEDPPTSSNLVFVAIDALDVCGTVASRLSPTDLTPPTPLSLKGEGGEEL